MLTKRLDKALNRLAGVALELSKAVWKARCTWSNGIESNAQTRNRWREAVAIIASERDLELPHRRRLYALSGPQFGVYLRQIIAEGAGGGRAGPGGGNGARGLGNEADTAA